MDYQGSFSIILKSGKHFDYLAPLAYQLDSSHYN